MRLALTNLPRSLGEVAKQFSEPVHAATPAVPWVAAAKVRDRLVHDCFDINLDMLWSTLAAADRMTRADDGCQGWREMPNGISSSVAR